jgi:hypothetical protein
MCVWTGKGIWMLYEQLDMVLEAILEETRETLFPPGRRVQMSLAHYRIVFDHHNAIARLLELELHASAFALARPLYESLVKGLWISHFADDTTAEKYAVGKELDDIERLTKRLLEADLPSVVTSHVRRIKERYWKALSSLTHGGHAQVHRWLNPEGVAPNYQVVELTELANFSSFICLVAGIERARLGGNAQALENLSELLPKDN